VGGERRFSHIITCPPAAPAVSIAGASILDTKTVEPIQTPATRTCSARRTRKNDGHPAETLNRPI
jgi:hypothetical protein